MYTPNVSSYRPVVAGMAAPRFGNDDGVSAVADLPAFDGGDVFVLTKIDSDIVTPPVEEVLDIPKTKKTAKNGKPEIPLDETIFERAKKAVLSFYCVPEAKANKAPGQEGALKPSEVEVWHRQARDLHDKIVIKENYLSARRALEQSIVKDGIANTKEAAARRKAFFEEHGYTSPW